VFQRGYPVKLDKGLRARKKGRFKLKTIVSTFVFTVAALAVASTTYVSHYGVQTSPSQNVEMGIVPAPCGLPGLPVCPWQQSTQAKSEQPVKVVAE
jgi:hypothetical protein